MIYTDFGEFELIQNYRDAFVLDDFIHRYVECFDRYMYIVGDYSSGLLRLKGFNNLGKGNSKKNIPDYIAESCVFNCPYFILKNVKCDPNKVIPEE